MNDELQYYSRTVESQKDNIRVFSKTTILFYDVRMLIIHKTKKLNSMALVRERTVPTERPPPVGEVSANFCG
jgi:hypothetical protein